MALFPSSARPWRVTRLQVTLAVILAAAAFLAVTQIRNELLIRQQLRVPSQRLEELGFTLQEMERNRATLETQILQLRSQLHAYEQGAAQGREQLEILSKHLERLRALAGHTHVAGPGLTVELDDSPLPLRPGDDPNTVILHYTDLQGVVNDLFASGAEAVAINGERVVSATGLNCVGTTIICNAKRLAPPYQVIAIGPPEEMLAYLERPDSVVQALRAFAFPVKITKAVRVGVPAFRGSYRFTHARPSGPFE